MIKEGEGVINKTLSVYGTEAVYLNRPPHFLKNHGSCLSHFLICLVRNVTLKFHCCNVNAEKFPRK